MELPLGWFLLRRKNQRCYNVCGVEAGLKPLGRDQFNSRRSHWQPGQRSAWTN